MKKVKKEKSSINFINGDHKINLLEKIVYFFFFIVEIFYDAKVKSDHKHNYDKKELIKFWGSNNVINFSPVRFSCDSYFINYLNKYFSKDREITVLEMGCGDGKYSKYIKNLGYQIKYIGIDQVENIEWEKLSNKETCFEKISLGDNETGKLSKLKKFRNVDLIFSHSCLEHIKNDISALREVNFLFPDAHNIHFVPAPISILNYFKHGYRRYSKSNIERLGLTFKNKFSLIPLGNHNSIKLFFPRYYQYYNKKIKFDIFNYSKKVISYEKDVETTIFSKKNNYPVYYCIIF